MAVNNQIEPNYIYILEKTYFFTAYFILKSIEIFKQSVWSIFNII